MRASLDTELYRKVYLIRRAEEAIMARYSGDEMKTPCHMSLGQEAIPAAVCQALGPADRVVGSYRTHGLYLARTEDTDGFFAELYGRATGTAQGKAGSMHLGAPQHGHLGSSAVVGTYIPVGVGAALANRRLGRRDWVAVFFGDGATDEGVFLESLNFAALHRLRVLFVCEDNGLAIHTSTAARRGFDRIAEIVRAYRCQVRESSSTVARELYDLIVEVQAAAEEAGCPAFLNLRCYRYLEHVGVAEDFKFGYRDAAECERWKAVDPVSVQRPRAVAEAGETAVRRLEADVDARIERSIAAARAAPFAPPQAVYSDLFAGRYPTAEFEQMLALQLSR